MQVVSSWRAAPLVAGEVPKGIFPRRDRVRFVELSVFAFGHDLRFRARRTNGSSVLFADVPVFTAIRVDRNPLAIAVLPERNL